MPFRSLIIPQDFDLDFFRVTLYECVIEQYPNPRLIGLFYVLILVKAKEKLEEVRDAEIMVNMTLEAADQAMMRAMDADQRAKNASARMDQLIQVSRDLKLLVISVPFFLRMLACNLHIIVAV